MTLKNACIGFGMVFFILPLIAVVAICGGIADGIAQSFSHKGD